MALPPGFVDELRTRLSIAQVVGRKVVWDARKSNQGKGDMWAPCPFHQEKSASFHVDDRKGYYYCFGCHAKGDAISFVRETENVGFIEAVGILAAEAGMQVPAPDPQAQAKADRRTQLSEVMEQAVQYFRLQLKTAAASEARDYLAGRGLAEAAQDRFEMGFAPDAWQGLWAQLTGKGVAEDLIMGCGLAKASQKGGKPYDTFRGRIMFPIRDARGRAIGFGGRAMDPNDNAKYLNSPETELFDKGRSLYNHGPAREAAGKGKPLIVAEGYMDVIALAEAGFGAAVAPLGTAVTEDQLRLLWRIAPEPVIALDGDTAGLRAAMRVIDTALPLLEAGQSLRFALMPQGQDPDDLIRAQGPQAMQKLVDGALPMVQLLWRRETEGMVFDSPERKAALDKTLRDVIRRIQDPSVRNHYGEEIKRLRWELFRRASAPGGGARVFGGVSRWQGGKTRPTVPMAGTRASFLATGQDGSGDTLREAVILATLITHPELLPEFEDALESGVVLDPAHAALVGCLLRLQPAADCRATVEAELGAGALENLFAQRHVQISPGIRRSDDLSSARMCVAEELAKLQARRGAAREVSDAEQDIGATLDEGVTWRLGQAAEARNRAERSPSEDKTEYEIGPNGARISRDERSAFDRLLDQISHGKST